MFPAAFKRLSLYGLLAIAPWAACAQAAPPSGPERPGIPGHEGDGFADVPGVPPILISTPPAMRSVRKLSDSELTCAQIYAETRELEQTSRSRQMEAMQAHQAMTETQDEMMKQADRMRGGGMGAAVGSSLIGMIPGAGQVQGHAMRATADARRAGMQESAHKMVQAQTRLMNAEQSLEHVQARAEHLAGWFLTKGCRLSEVESTAASKAR